MKKSNLKVVANPLGAYYFSFSSCRITEVGAYVLGAAVGISICLFFVLYPDHEGSISRAVLTALPYALGFAVPIILIGLSMTIQTKRVKKIMTLGDELDGEIISYCRKRMRRRKLFSAKPTHTILIIKFNYHGEYYCTLNVGHRLPQKVLASIDCKVYVYNDCLFVAGFELRTGDMPQIEFKEEDFG